MTIQVTILVGVCGLILSILTFVAGTKKNSKEDGYNLGKFEGDIARIEEAIKSIKEMIAEIKIDLHNEENKIAEAIKNHERIYHNGGIK